MDQHLNTEFDQVARAEVRVRDRIPMPVADGSRLTVVSFYGLSREHVALVYEGTQPETPLLARIHSKCFTGDLLGSLRCDCGEQLKEAQKLMRKSGGVIFYMDQEGRGIGLIKKLAAYALQDRGMDTFQANAALNHPEDARTFDEAGLMLQALDVAEIRLITNNPDKVAGLKGYVDIAEVIPTGTYETPENSRYIKAKRERGHTLG